MLAGADVLSIKPTSLASQLKRRSCQRARRRFPFSPICFALRSRTCTCARARACAFVARPSPRSPSVRSVNAVRDEVFSRSASKRPSVAFVIIQISPDRPTAVRPPDRPTVRPPDRPTARSPDRPTARPPDRPTARPPDRPTARPYVRLSSPNCHSCVRNKPSDWTAARNDHLIRPLM